MDSLLLKIWEVDFGIDISEMESIISGQGMSILNESKYASLPVDTKYFHSDFKSCIEQSIGHLDESLV